MLTKIVLIFLFNYANIESPPTSFSASSIKTNLVKIDKDSIRSRIEQINSQTPFQIDYTPLLEETIINYLKNRQATYLELYSKADYFFPIFENALQKYNVPLELKYLPVIESALNPRAKSRVGATGLWQIMFNTAKEYGLIVSSYVDERMDVEKSTEAACQYFQKSYTRFNDWESSIASYNVGKIGNDKGLKTNLSIEYMINNNFKIINETKEQVLLSY